MNPAASDLRAEFIKCGVADDGVVLKSKVEIAGLVVARARAGVLPEDLILRSRGKPGYERRRNAHAKERIVAIVPALIEASGPQTGLLHDRVVASNSLQRGEGCGEGRDVDAKVRAGCTVVDGLTRRTRYGNRELAAWRSRRRNAFGLIEAVRNSAKIKSVQGNA